MAPFFRPPCKFGLNLVCQTALGKLVRSMVVHIEYDLSIRECMRRTRNHDATFIPETETKPSIRRSNFWSRNQSGLKTIRYDTRCYFNVRSKADMSRLNLPHGNQLKIVKLKSTNRYARSDSKSLGNHVVSHEEERERLQWEGFAEKKVLSLE